MAIRKGPQDIELAFSDVLLSWLRHRYNVDRFGPPTWRKLVEAVDSQTNPALAAAIAARHPANSMLSLSCQRPLPTYSRTVVGMADGCAR